MSLLELEAMPLSPSAGLLGQRSQALPSPSPSESLCEALATSTQLSQALPSPSLSVSHCVWFQTLTQLSQASPAKSASASGPGMPKPSASETESQRSHWSPAPSRSVSVCAGLAHAFATMHAEGGQLSLP